MYGYGMNSDFEHRRVAIYARVSTEHEAQVSALGNQIDWYKPILAARPEWELVAQYIDEGITGTSAEKRPQFMKMIQDARSKKFDMIITREVSRFARNTVDTLQYTRKLKEYGCEVFFINDNIKTFDGDGELRLTIMATLAQDESRKTSIRVKSGQQTSMENGVFYGNGNILGYDRVGDKMVINEEQAKTVRMIFDMYLSGMGTQKIAYELERRGRLTAMGKEHWYCGYVCRLLRNSFYCGIITYHKAFTPDYLKQKRILNHGQLELVRTKGTHTPIVTEEEFNRVQEILNEKSAPHKPNENGGFKTIGCKGHKSAYGRLMVCKCGKHFNQRTHIDSYGRHAGTDYQCYTSVNLGSKNVRQKKGLDGSALCDTPYLPGWKLDLQASMIFREYIRNADDLVEMAAAMLEKHINDREEVQDNTDRIVKKQVEVEKIRNKMKNLIEMREEGDVDHEYFQTRKKEFERKIDKLTEEIEVLRVEKESAIQQKTEPGDRLDYLKKKLKEYTSIDSTVPESLVEAFFEKIWVSNNEFRWYLRNADKRKEDDAERIEIASFTVIEDDARKFMYDNCPRRRVFNWYDFKVSIWV